MKMIQIKRTRYAVSGCEGGRDESLIQKKKMIKENFEWLVLKLVETNLKGEYV
jgi:hypothetical protein